MELQPWSENDLPLVERFLSNPQMMKYLGGPQDPDKILQAHRRYLALAVQSKGGKFKIVFGHPSVVAGSVGYRERTWQDKVIYEMGWSVFPEHQGQGIAGRAAAVLLLRIRSEKKYRFLHAFPSVSNPQSNSICKRLGFTNVEECETEYPAGCFMRSNNWRLDLFAQAG